MRRHIAPAAIACALAAGLAAQPIPALAATGDSDIILGAFFTSEADQTDTVYASYDGEEFHALSTPYRDLTPDSEASNAYAAGHYTHKCPGICYHDGYFWMLSNWNREDGRFWPMLSYSKDLVHWTTPEGLYLGDGYSGVELAEQPDNKPGAFDVVAPKMHEASDGSLYITFSAGRYTDSGATDRMQVYTCKVDELSATDGTQSQDGSGTLKPHITLRTEPARKVSAEDVDNGAGANIIDSNIYAEGDTTYLLLKRGGLTEEIYSSQTPDDPSSWELVDDDVSWGYEGVALARANGAYHLFGDGVRGTRDLGVRAVTSESVTRDGTWTDDASTDSDSMHAVSFEGEDGQDMTARHGDVVTLEAGTPEWQVAHDLLADEGVEDPGQAPVEVSCLLNPNSGERLYTADSDERDNLVGLGWQDEGVAWEAPSESGTPVFRLYREGSGHRYTTSTDERDSLIDAGWHYEGIAFWSDDDGATPIVRTSGAGGTSYAAADDPTDAADVVWYGV